MERLANPTPHEEDRRAWRELLCLWDSKPGHGAGGYKECMKKTTQVGFALNSIHPRTFQDQIHQACWSKP